MNQELNFSPEAIALHKESWIKYENEFRESGRFHLMNDWGSKYLGNVVRIAGVLHCATHPDNYLNIQISKAVLENAFRVGEYLIPHAQAAYNLISENDEILMAKRFLAWVKQHDLKHFSQNDCHKRFKNTLATAAQVAKVLSVLEERNYIRPILRQSSSVGRPSRVYEVNPQVFNSVDFVTRGRE